MRRLGWKSRHKQEEARVITILWPPSAELVYQCYNVYHLESALEDDMHNTVRYERQTRRNHAQWHNDILMKMRSFESCCLNGLLIPTTKNL